MINLPSGTYLVTRVDENDNFVEDTFTSADISTLGGALDAEVVKLIGDQTVSGDKTFANDVVFESNITVSGSIISTEQFLVEDNIITLNSTVTGTPTQDAGFEVERGTSNNALFLWDESQDRFIAGISGSEEIVVYESDLTDYLLNSDFSTYSGTLQSDINTRLKTSDFTTYSGTLQTDINTRLTTAAFTTHSGNLQTQITTLDNTTVKLTGNQTVSGTKTFLDDTVIGSWTFDGRELICVSGQNYIIRPTANNAAGTLGGGSGATEATGARISVFGKDSSNPDQCRIHAGSTTPGYIGLYIGATERWRVTSGNDFVPIANNSYDIGSASANVRDIHATTLTSFGDLTLEASGADGDITIAAAGTGTVAITTVTGNASITAVDITLTAADDFIIDCADNMIVDYVTAWTIRTNGTDRWEFGSTGTFAPATDRGVSIGSPSARVNIIYADTLNIDQNDSGSNVATFLGSNASFAARVLEAQSNRTASTSYRFLSCESDSDGTPDTEFNFRGDGNGFCDGAFAGGGADYAEYFESTTGLELAVGESVVLESGKVRVYDSQIDEQTDIIGVVRPKVGGSASIGNLPLKWHNKYLRDDYGAYILDEENERQLNPEFDEEQEYVSRENRPEWNVIGLLGQVPINNASTKKSTWVYLRDVSQNVKLYFVR